MEQATPTSPWQPTSAPEMEAFARYRLQMADAVSRNTLSYDNKEVLFASLLCATDSIENVTLEVELNLRNKYSCCTNCDTGIKCKIACTSAHNLNN